MHLERRWLLHGYVRLWRDISVGVDVLLLCRLPQQSREVAESLPLLPMVRLRDRGQISNCARGAGIDIIRDVNKIDFLNAITAFMGTAADSRYFVAVMTESYFYSRFCMYEFCQLIESDQPIRTIPVMLGRAAEPGIESKWTKYWCGKHQDLSQAIRGIDKRYTSYLRPELDLK